MKKQTRQKNITSEFKLAVSLARELLLFPINLLKVMFKKENSKVLAKPFKILHDFASETKLTLTLIGLNFIVYIISGFLSGEVLLYLVNSPQNMLSGRFYSLITSGFLHADLGHLFGNMLFIFIFGRILERKLGEKKTALIYFGAMFISAVISNLIYILMGQNVTAVGASGALMGLVSAAILLDPFYLTFILIIPVPVMIVGWIAIYGDIVGVLSPVQTNIGYFAHIGGFISIAVLVYLLNEKDRKKMKNGLYINLLSLLIASILLFILQF